MNLHVHSIGVVVGSCVLASAVAHAQVVPRPKIETYFGFAKSGGVGAIVGKAFGTTPGKAQARLKDSKGVAYVIDLRIIRDKNTNVPEWKPTVIGVEWPVIFTVEVEYGDGYVGFDKELAGFPDQDASIWVTRAWDGKSSNKYTVPFKPGAHHWRR
jgi:hypothetical protein